MFDGHFNLYDSPWDVKYFSPPALQSLNPEKTDPQLKALRIYFSLKLSYFKPAFVATWSQGSGKPVIDP